ncbi:hypothetical protein [Lacinutrix chionoecetis]
MLKINVNQSQLSNKIVEIYKHDIGVLYFLDNVVISEINEGEHVDMEAANHLTERINLFYNGRGLFGYISNRVNDFSLSPLDFTNFQVFMKNIKSYCAVTYLDINSKNTSLERHFCTLPYQDFSCLEEAYRWSKSIVEKEMTQINN